MKGIICSIVACLALCSSRAVKATELELRAIVPDHVGLMLQKSPVLYYFISEPTTLPIRFFLRESRATRGAIELSLPSPNRPGYWPVRLKDYGIILNPGVEYRWFISVIMDQEEIVAGGSIECCPEDLLFIWDGRRCDKEKVHAYAKAGIWYDAFACLSELIEAEPNNQKL